MSAAETQREFVDTNILIYSVDPGSDLKASRSAALMDDLWARRAGCVSIQVLQEFYVSVTRKLTPPLPATEATARVSDLIGWNVHSPKATDLLAAIDLQQQYRISFWDAMIVQSARAMDCGVLWTEDLNDGQRYADVLVRNPFTDAVMDRGTV